MDEVIGGWKLSTALVTYSGFPEVITGGSSNSNSYGSNRVNQYRKLKMAGRSNANWFGTDPSATPCKVAGVDNGTCAFGVPANNTFGTESNGAMRGPGYFNTDLSAFKDFHTFREEVIGFRFDAFNAFNIVSYGNPDTGITDSTFGNVSLAGLQLWRTRSPSSERHWYPSRAACPAPKSSCPIARTNAGNVAVRRRSGSASPCRAARRFPLHPRRLSQFRFQSHAALGTVAGWSLLDFLVHQDIV